MSSLESWREEVQSAHLYRVVLEGERDAARRVLFAGLAAAAEQQAGLWAARIEKEGGAVPRRLRLTWRVRIAAWLVRRLGARRVLPVLAAAKVRGLSAFSAVPPSPQSHPMPRTLADFGQRHRAFGRGGSLRAAVFGINDGLVSNTSLIMGVAGAAPESRFVLLSGVAGLVAGALSMAAGEYVSMRSQRELFEYQIGLEREELALYPDEETEEMALIYHARGLDMDAARDAARTLMKDPEMALDLLAREELGLNPDDLGSPWGAALWSFLAFSVGAFVPLVPFLLVRSGAVVVAAALAAAALFFVGMSISLFTGRNAFSSGLRMLLIGAAAGAVTHLLGRLVGVTVS